MRALDFSLRRLRTKFGGLFLFLPYPAELPFDALIEQAGLHGSQMIPAACAVRSLLALKPWGNARHSHVTSDVRGPAHAELPFRRVVNTDSEGW